MARVWQQKPGFFQKLAVGPELRRATLEAAEKAKAIAEGLSAGIRSDREHQHYADSFETETETIDWTGEYPGRRVSGVLRNTAPHAAAVEWGYKGRRGEPSKSAHHVLGRTLDALGGSK